MKIIILFHLFSKPKLTCIQSKQKKNDGNYLLQNNLLNEKFGSSGSSKKIFVYSNSPS